MHRPARGSARLRSLVALVVVAAATSVRSTAAPSTAPRTGETKVRVVERGSRRPVAGAIVDVFPAEIGVYDSWIHRVVGDDLIPREPSSKESTSSEATPSAKSVPGTASTWIPRGSRAHATCDESGVATFEGSFDEGATLVASTATLRGARVVFVAPNAAAPSEVELEVGPRRSVELFVRGVDGQPRANVPVEFGRFLVGAPSRRRGDGEELWDALGARATTDERGHATLTELELHGADDLDVARGAKPGPFCVRALVVGATRVCVAVDPDDPPPKPVELTLPPVGTVRLTVDLPDHEAVDVDGSVEITSKSGAPFAPGFPLFAAVRHGRAELFPVEAARPGEIGVRSEVLGDGDLSATVVVLGGVTDFDYGDSFPQPIESRGGLPSEDRATSDTTLTFPTGWFAASARLLASDGRPVVAADVECRLLYTPQHTTGSATRERTIENVKSDGDGRLHLLARRPNVPRDLRLEFAAVRDRTIVLDRKVVPFVFGADLWKVDLGDVVFAALPTAPAH